MNYSYCQPIKRYRGANCWKRGLQCIKTDSTSILQYFGLEEIIYRQHVKFIRKTLLVVRLAGVMDFHRNILGQQEHSRITQVRSCVV